jgi:hypothetical protein
MFLIDTVIVLAILFFLFMPVTARRTVQMKVAILCTLLALFTISVKRTPVPQTQLAGTVSTR